MKNSFAITSDASHLPYNVMDSISAKTIQTNQKLVRMNGQEAMLTEDGTLIHQIIIFRILDDFQTFEQQRWLS